ncbi:MAG TPA: dTDP-4-dehydrorhamnose 3,5-epimerase [Candidatus Limnocylindria bacterium]|nr:dTDP-4-dehydrorhamnose 3,5-epimerase [Candidatus Limnocylindria bacterium]
MIFADTRLPGVLIVEPERHEDERGFFARAWCAQEFEARGLNARLAQCSISYNRARGTVRGMHYQAAPWHEAKLVRCTRGAIHDVALDVRPGAPTYGQWVAVRLTADDRRMLYVPEGMAHGFQTLADDTEVFYQISEVHHPDAARGVRWNDPACGIDWPLAPVIVSERDAGLPLLGA